jgi:hypothetical protein
MLYLKQLTSLLLLSGGKMPRLGEGIQLNTSLTNSGEEFLRMSAKKESDLLRVTL